jgi:hypothetical protein
MEQLNIIEKNSNTNGVQMDHEQLITSNFDQILSWND